MPSVVTARDLEDLLRPLGLGGGAERALANRAVAREKVEGSWLYFESAFDFGSAVAEFENSARQVIREWFLGTMPFVPNAANQRCGRTMTSAAAKVVTRSLVRAGRFGALGLLTEGYQPYLALFDLDDGEAIENALSVALDLLQTQPRVGAWELPDPPRPIESPLWRHHVLRHAEFLGMGAYDHELVRWDGL